MSKFYQTMVLVGTMLLVGVLTASAIQAAGNEIANAIDYQTKILARMD